MIRVLVKASSPVVQAGLEQMIASEPDFHLVTGPDGRHPQTGTLDEEQADVLVAETDESDEDAQWTDLLELGGSGSALLLLADDLSAFPGAAVLRSGARGILPRGVSRDELVAAVKAAAAGLINLHAESIPATFPGGAPLLSRTAALIEPLTAREKEVLQILAEGGSNKEIASRLAISEHTAKFHVASIMSKLGATSRTEAVTLAIRQGIIML